jgi:hypothetical protein
MKKVNGIKKDKFMLNRFLLFVCLSIGTMPAIYVF